MLSQASWFNCHPSINCQSLNDNKNWSKLCIVPKKAHKIYRKIAVTNFLTVIKLCRKEKYWSTENTKIEIKDKKLLPKKLRGHRIKGTNKHSETSLIRYDTHRGSLPQSEENKCMWTHSKDDITCVYLCFSSRDLYIFREEFTLFIPIFVLIKQFFSEL